MNEKEYLTALDDDQIHLTTRPYLNKVNTHTAPYDVTVFGEEITVLPGVMSPKYDWAGVYMIDYIPKDFSGQNVLELGPGSGLVSVFVGLRGAKSITAADINPAAIENTKINFEKFKLTNAVAVVSDVFSNVPKIAYDSIIFNLPYHNGVPANDLEKGVIDADYYAMETLLAEVKHFLKEDGKLYLGFSQSGDVVRFKKALETNNLKIDDFEEKNDWNDPAYSGPDFNYNCQVYTCSLKKGS
ncbi:MAG: N-methyl-transferase [Parcubacteria bacterium C7867-008]|nr:MAG: N-methyl-transferase [Parcubacteria bacterium C7867-008]